MADDAAGAVGGTATKARGAKKKGGKGKGGGRFKKMEKRRGTGIVVLDDDDVADATAATTQNTEINASDGLSPVAEEGAGEPAPAETGSSSGRRRRHRKERGEKSEGSHSKRDAIIRGEKIEEEFDGFESQETFRLKLKLAEANNRISYLEAQLMLMRQDLKEHQERLDHVEEEKRALVIAMGKLQAS